MFCYIHMKVWRIVISSIDIDLDTVNDFYASQLFIKDTTCCLIKQHVAFWFLFITNQ